MQMPKGITKCREPGFSNHRSKAWKETDVLLNGDVVVKGHYEAFKGKYFYFKVDDYWRCGKLQDFVNAIDDEIKSIDLRFEKKQTSKPTGPRPKMDVEQHEESHRSVWVAIRVDLPEPPQVAVGKTKESAMISLSEYLFPEEAEEGKSVDALDDALEKGSLKVECWQEDIRY